MTALPQHQMLTVEHGTPHEIVAFARAVLGGIDCDPCSSAYFNEHVVQAPWFWDAENPWKDGDPGADLKWLINPPSRLVREFWRFATARWLEGSAVLWVGFNLDQLAYLSTEGIMRPEFVRALLPHRLKFLRAVEGGPPVPAPNPTRHNYLVLLPSAHEQVKRFRELARALPAEVF